MMAMKESQRIIEMVVEKKRRTHRTRGAGIAALLLAGSATASRAADPAAGQQVFKAQCGICHAVVAGRNGVGPTLFGVVGRSGRQRSRLPIHRRPQEARRHLGRRQPR